VTTFDFHNHIIPGVDDGARSLEESSRALAEMADQGIGVIVTTPHLNASDVLSGNAGAYMALVEQKWNALEAMSREEFPQLRVDRGFEVLLDAPRVDLSDFRLRLAGTRFVLVEFPMSSLPPSAAEALFDIRVKGYTPVMAHPERYHYMDDNLTLAKGWIRAGAYLQVNLGSLTGRYGRKARALAWRCLEQGIASYLFSDFHARGECPTRRALAVLDARSHAMTELLTQVNPERLLSGLEPLAAEPLTQRRRLHHWLSRFFRSAGV